VPVDLLADPSPFSAAPLAVATFITRGGEPSLFKVILLVQFLGAATAETPPSYGISITNAKDEPVFVGTDKTVWAGPLGARGIAAVHLSGGRYRLRAAVVDASGRPGSIDTPMDVGLRRAGPFEVSDLMLGQLTDRFLPAAQLPAGIPIAALIEVYRFDPMTLDDLAVDLELRKSSDDAILARGTATLARIDLEDRRAAAGQVSTVGLAPGDYDVSAIIRNGVVRVGIVTRRIAIAAP